MVTNWTTIERFDVITDFSSHGYGYGTMMQDATGNWVRFSDAQTIISHLTSEIERLRRVIVENFPSAKEMERADAIARAQGG